VGRLTTWLGSSIRSESSWGPIGSASGRVLTGHSLSGISSIVAFGQGLAGFVWLHLDFSTMVLILAINNSSLYQKVPSFQLMSGFSFLSQGSPSMTVSFPSPETKSFVLFVFPWTVMSVMAVCMMVPFFVLCSI
jgi:hypothetical protein